MNWECHLQTILHTERPKTVLNKEKLREWGSWERHHELVNPSRTALQFHWWELNVFIHTLRQKHVEDEDGKAVSISYAWPWRKHLHARAHMRRGSGRWTRRNWAQAPDCLTGTTGDHRVSFTADKPSRRSAWWSTKAHTKRWQRDYWREVGHRERKERAPSDSLLFINCVQGGDSGIPLGKWWRKYRKSWLQKENIANKTEQGLCEWLSGQGNVVKCLFQPHTGGSSPAAFSEGLGSEASKTLKPKCYLSCYSTISQGTGMPLPDGALLVTGAVMFLRGAFYFENSICGSFGIQN